MALTRDEMDRIMDEHFKHEINDDIEGVLNTLAPDVIHDIVGSPTGPTQGRDQARPFYEALFADLSEGSIQTQNRLYGENFLVDESVWEGKAVGRPFGLEGKGRPLHIRILHVMEFHDNGQIKKENVWLDQAGIMQQLPQI